MILYLNISSTNMILIVMEIDSTFKLVKVKDKDETHRYKEYRKKWVENPSNNIIEKVPIHLDLEVTSACNLRCPFCFQSYDTPPPGFMEFSLYKKIIDECAPKGLLSVKLMYRGEPLLHQEMAKFVKYAKDNGIVEVMFNTNATLLTEQKIVDLIEAGTDKIICSVDGMEKEVYEKHRVGANFENVLNNIKNLKKIKERMNSKKPFVRIQMIDTPQLHEKTKEYINFWEPYADEIGVEDLLDWEDDKVENPKQEPSFACAQLWQRLIVLFNGDIILCCGDHLQKIPVGNAKEISIENLWNSPRLVGFRKLHLEGKSHLMSSCRGCSLRKNYIKRYELKNISNE